MGLNATSMGWKPRAPYSADRCENTSEACWQCGHVVWTNNSATTLPRKLESAAWLPSTKRILNSGEGLSIGGSCAVTTNAAASNRAAPRINRIGKLLVLLVYRRLQALDMVDGGAADPGSEVAAVTPARELGSGFSGDLQLFPFSTQHAGVLGQEFRGGLRRVPG